MNMTFEELQRSIDTIDSHFHNQFKNSSPYERLLTRAVKLNEEVGELCEAVLHENNEQRVEKTDIDLPSEIADVIICTLMIAHLKNVDVWGEVAKKIEKIKMRNHIPS